MTKGVRATLIMFIVLAALVAFVVYTNNTEEAAVTPQPSLYVWDVTTEDVASVQVVDHTEETEVTLSRDHTGLWQVESSKTSGGEELIPLQLADPSQGDYAASLVSTLFVQRTLTETTEIAEFGLDTPLYTINIRDVDGVEQSLGVGLKTPPEDGYYVLPSGAQNAIIVNTGSLDPLIAFITTPPLVPTPLPEVTESPSAGPAETGTPDS